MHYRDVSASDRTESSWPLLPACAFAGATVLCNGYRFGVADHGVHLPFVDMVFHRERWEGDLLVEAFAHHHSLFWYLLAPFVEVLGAPLAYALLHLGASILLGGVLVRLLETLGARGVGLWAALLFLAPAHFALGGARSWDPLVLNRTVALPLELAALHLALRGEPLRPLALLGLAAWLHAPSAAAMAAGLLAMAVFEPRGRTRRMLLGFGSFALAAAPLAVVAAASGGLGSSLQRVDGLWWQIVRLRLPHHVLPSTWPADHWIWGLGILSISIAGVARLRPKQADLRRRCAAVLGGLVLWAVVTGSVLGEGAQLALALQLEAWQATRFLPHLAAGLILAPLCAAAEQRARALPAWAVILAALGLGTLLARCSPTAEPWRVQIFGEEESERALGRTIRAAVPPGELIAPPPETFESLRVHSQRPSLANWKDGGEALFDRGVALRWLDEVSAGCACDPLAPSPGLGPGTQTGISALKRRLREGRRATSREELRRRARAAGASWGVEAVEESGPRDTRHRLQRLQRPEP